MDQRELELLSANQLVRRALRANQIGLWTWNFDQAEISFGANSVELLAGYLGAHSEPGKQLSDRVHHEDRERIDAVRANAVDESQSYQIDYRVSDFRGFTQWLRETADCEVDGSGRCTIVGTIQFVTEEKERELALARSNRELEQFAYVASHDLQEPLRTVRSYVDLIDQRFGDSLPDETGEFMAFITKATRRLEGMIRSLLEFSRLASDVEEREAVSLSELVDFATSPLQKLIKEKSAMIDFKGPDHELFVAPQQMQRVIQNLIENGIKFHGEDPPQITITSLPLWSGQRVIVTIRDNGIGIPAASHDRIFKIFKRLRPHSGSAGHGIGLAICQRIVEDHDGSISVESNPAAGSAFSFDVAIVAKSE
ncbi:MAG: ATP-binding protein [Verrucomicrobiota bacterium]